MVRDYSVPAIHRAVQVIELLAASHSGFSLAEVSRQTGIPKSSLFRILAALEQHSIVLQDHERKIFRLGMKLLDWGNAALEKIDLKTIVHPYLIRMAHETSESYYLTILDGHEVIIIDRADNPEMWSIVARLGARSPVHATASGQVLIADLPEESLDRIIDQSGLKRFTAKTITNGGAAEEAPPGDRARRLLGRRRRIQGRTSARFRCRSTTTTGRSSPP